MGLTAKFVADFSSFTKAVADAQVSLKSFETGASKVGPALNKMVDNFSGRKLITDANLMAEAVSRIGGPAKLTGIELQNVATKAAAAVEKMKAMGIEVPPQLTTLAGHVKTTGGLADDIKAKFAQVGPAIVAAFSVGAVIGAIKGFTDFTGKLTDLSAKTGIGVEALQRLKYAAELNGGTLEQVTGVINKLGINLAGGKDSAKGALDALGLSFTAIRAMSPDKAFTTIGDAIAKIEDPMARTKLGTELMGKGFAEVLPMMRGNLSETAAAADRLGLVMSEDAVAAGDKFGDSMTTLSLVGQALMATVLEPIIPILTEVALWFSDHIPSALADARTSFDWLIKSGMEVKLSFDRFLLSMVELGAKVPWLGAKLGMTSANVEEMRAQVRWSEDALKAFTSSTAKTGTAVVKTAGSFKTLNLDLDDTTKSAKKAADDVAKLVARLGGGEAIAAANLWIKALPQIGGLARLNTKDHNELHGVLTKALAAYKEMGIVPPAAMRALADSVTPVLVATKSFGAIVDGPSGLKQNFTDLSDNVLPSYAATLFSATEHTDALGRVTYKQLVPSITASKIGFAETEKKVSSFDTSLDSLGTAFSELANVADGSMGSMARSVGTVISSMKLAGQGGAAMAAGFKQGGAEGFSNMAAGAIAAVGAIDAATNSTSKLKNVMGGAASGAMAGSKILPVFGTAVGAVAGALVGLWKSNTLESRTVSPLRDAFFEAAGGLEALNAEVYKSTGSLKLVEDIFKSKNTEQYNAAVSALQATMAAVAATAKQAGIDVESITTKLSGVASITPEVQAAFDLAFSAETPAAFAEALGGINCVLDAQGAKSKELDETLKKYGLSWKDLGNEARAAELATTASGIEKEFRLLQAAGVDVNAIMRGMGKSINTFTQDAKATGTEVPESFRDVIQTAIDAGEVFDKNGVKITQMKDLGIVFGTTMEQATKNIADSIGRLVELLEKKLGPAIAGVPDADFDIRGHVNIDTSKIPKGYDAGGTSNAATGGLVTNKGVARYLSAGAFVARGTDTVPAMLTPGERVLSVKQNRAYETGGAGAVVDFNAFKAEVAALRRDMARRDRNMPHALATAVRDALVLVG